MKRPDFIANYEDLIEEDNTHYRDSNELLGIGAAVGKKLGLKKIGIHIETLLPGRRTSWPHAEKEEEEFVYVISGQPQVWIDGYIHELKAGDFIAFPAGTGIAHTFINNSDDVAILLVGGEANKATNKIYYPLHAARNQQMKADGALWEDYPKKELGPHDGLPDKQRSKSGA
jgi:uncharacterized cupin superfamily protein